MNRSDARHRDNDTQTGSSHSAPWSASARCAAAGHARRWSPWRTAATFAAHAAQPARSRAQNLRLRGAGLSNSPTTRRSSRSSSLLATTRSPPSSSSVRRAARSSKSPTSSATTRRAIRRTRHDHTAKSRPARTFNASSVSDLTTGAGTLRVVAAPRLLTRDCSIDRKAPIGLSGHSECGRQNISVGLMKSANASRDGR